MAVINVPKDKGRSALEGYSLTAIDTDPDDTIGNVMAGMRLNGIEVIAVFPRKFRKVRDGYLVLTFDPKEKA